ncbi:hypothetical protein [Neorhizobium vignae]|uniref:hypothetical protein n=1 Tax=Neorhizobium vignae TaxID=690585 RepID=UPI0005654F0C|nr:hypothetical protein [Neorhizobium vignae]
MTDVPSPSVPPDDLNRHILCQMAIEFPLQEIIDTAVKAGWGEAEVLTAIIEVADNLVLAHGSNSELDALLKALKRNTE